jgi:hypothetical protein
MQQAARQKENEDHDDRTQDGAVIVEEMWPRRTLPEE